MDRDITLVILAAGMGSRFGGLKQIEPLGPNGEFIIDYSVYDAIKAGFTKIVFLIKEENYDIFKETIGARVEPHIKVEYCFQKNDNLIPSLYLNNIFLNFQTGIWEKSKTSISLTFLILKSIFPYSFI